MIDSMDLEEYRSWQAYALVEPFGHVREDLRIAKPIAALMSLQTKRPVKPSMLIHDFDEQYRDKAQRTPEQARIDFHNTLKGIRGG